MDHLIVAEIQALINDDVANVNLGDVSECNISILFWSSLLMLILYVDHILNGSLSLHPEFVICPKGIEIKNEALKCHILPIGHNGVLAGNELSFLSDNFSVCVV